MSEDVEAAAAPVDEAKKVVHSDGVLLSARQTMEYYFSDANYHKDTHLRGLEDECGWVDLEDLAEYPKLMKLVGGDVDALAEAAGASTELRLDGARVRRIPKKREQATHLVLDANALIRGRIGALGSAATEFWTVAEVLEEVRDPQSRAALAALPVDIQTREPSDWAMGFVAEFSRRTGDFRSLSTVDLRVLALTLMIETELAGDEKLRKVPEGLPLGKPTKPTAKQPPAVVVAAAAPAPVAPPLPPPKSWSELARRPAPPPGAEKEVVIAATAPAPVTTIVEEQEVEEEDDEEETVEDHAFFFGADFVVREDDDDDNSSFGDRGDSDDDDDEDRIGLPASPPPLDEEEKREYRSHILSGGGGGVQVGTAEEDDGEGWLGEENIETARATGSLFSPTTEHGNNEALLETTTLVPGAACATADFAMQNVLLQIGLRLISLDGMSVKRTKRWALRCDACFALESETMERLFCGRCGSDALRRVSYGVDAVTGKREVYLRKKPRQQDLRGTKFALPKPGTEGRYEGALLLREDQLLSGIWRQKAARARAHQPKSLAASKTYNAAETLEMIAVARPTAEIKVGFGRNRNPNSQKGRERRGKKKKAAA